MAHYHEGNETRIRRTASAIADIERFALIIGMDEANVRNIRRMLGSNVAATKLLDYTDHPRDIADPWYTLNFDDSFDDILEGFTALLGCLFK